MGDTEHEFGSDSLIPTAVSDSLSSLFDPAHASGAGMYSVDHYMHMLQVPGNPPVDMTPDAIAVEQSAGRNWLDYAIIGGPIQGLIGRALHGWVCIDSTGARWYIKPIGAPALHMGTIAAADALPIELEVRPFGYLGQAPAEPVTLSETLADIGQVSVEPDLVLLGIGLRPLIHSISPDGRQVIIALKLDVPATPSNQRPLFYLPVGWLRLTLAGDGPGFTVSTEVLYTRDRTTGLKSDEYSSTLRRLQGDMVLDYSIDTVGGVQRQHLAATGEFEYVPASFPWEAGTQSRQFKITDRVCNLAFGADGELVAITADIDIAMELDVGEVTVGSYSGELVADQASSAANSGVINFTRASTGFDHTTVRITTRRDGVAIESAEWTDEAELSSGSSVERTPANTPNHAEWGASPSFVANVGELRPGLRALRTYRFTINGSERWSWAAPTTPYIAPSIVSRSIPVTTPLLSVGLLPQVVGSGRTARWVYYRMGPGGNHAVSLSHQLYPPAVSSPDASTSFPTYIITHRFVGTGGDWAATGWASDAAGGFSQKSPAIPAYNAKTGEIFYTPGQRISGYFI